MAMPFALKIDVFAFSVVVNTLFAFGTWWLLVRHLRARFGDRAAIWGSFLFALSPSIWIWVSSGMETPLIVLLQTGIWLCTEDLADKRSSQRTQVLLCACIGLLVLARADGFISGLLAAGYLLISGRRRAAATAGAALICTFAALVAWRVAYYHDVLPNTYYAKVTSTLSRRLLSAVKEMGGIVSRQGLGPYLLAIAFSASPLLLRFVRDPRSAIRDVRFGLAFSLIWIGYWLYVGGDNFEDRFLIILIPIGISLLLGTVLQTASRPVERFALGIVVLFQLLPIVRQDQFGKRSTAKYDHRITLGRFLKEHAAGHVLATTAAGKIPFYSELRTIDMQGLCDLHIGRTTAKEFIPGHSKHDTEYVLSLKPDLIVVLFEGDGLDVAYMPAPEYRQAGYRIHYVVNSSPTTRGDDDVLDVLDRREEDIVLLSRIGWRLAVLERSPAQPSVPEPANR
jgi:hypothetical protein